MDAFRSKQIENIRERLDRVYEGIGVKDDAFEHLVEQMRDIWKDYDQLCSLEGFEQYRSICHVMKCASLPDNALGTVIEVGGKQSSETVGTSSDTMIAYINQKKSTIENAVATIQPLMELQRRIQNLPPPDETQQKALCDLDVRLSYIEREVVQMHKEIVSLVATYSQCIADINNLLLKMKT